ncbi:3-polyprenyl-4-hydroxybenzoate carboxy-lyase UbiX [Klebsiella pneumoniae]|nr:3-polyprenyl-4-hydroxybenzoate carboxy-lyase UbiX [Klebsiella pneumoniae]
MTPRIIIGISGASGFQYGVKALELLRPLAIEVHLVVSKGAEKNLRAGNGLPLR